MTAITKPIFLSLCILGLIALNSLLTQMLLMQEHHKTSVFGAIIWTGIYFAIGLGLVRKNRSAYIGGIVVSILQIVPVVLSRSQAMSTLFGLLPSWYIYTVYVSAVLGLVLLISLWFGRTR